MHNLAEGGVLTKILYIGRFYPDNGAGPLLRLRRRKNRMLRLRGQCGFMRASLHAGFDVTEADLGYLARHQGRIAERFDYLIVCSKADSSGEGQNLREFDFIAAIRDLPKALFVSNPQAGFMPDDRCLDRFDVVFKREHYADLDRYALTAANKNKIRLTWLACPLVAATRFNVRRIRPATLGFADVPGDYTSDVCFFGTQSAPLRPTAWAAIQNAGFDALGGIQGHDVDPEVDPRVFTPAIRRDGYIRAIRRARVNLALEGLGEFTHRHWELWLLCAFCLSSPSIRELALPGGAREGEQFVCFDDLDDLIAKTRFYAANQAARERIARQGRRLFEQHFDFRRHGAFVKACLDARA